MRSRHIGSGRLKEGGILATRKGDFLSHTEGGDFRHEASAIDMNPVPATLGTTNVQSSIEALVDAVLTDGSGFVSIGQIDGYSDGYTFEDGYVLGNYNVNTDDYPNLESAFTAAFANPRLQNGGAILILPGTYTMDSTVEVPPGITIMGDFAGTVIVGHMNEQPMFKVKQSEKLHVTIGGDIGGGEKRFLNRIDTVKFYNLILSDNLDGYIKSGADIVPSMSTVPMIQMERGAALECENVRFIGKVKNGTTARSKTKYAIGTTTGGSQGTFLTISNCWFDGVQVGIDFTPGTGELDFLTVQNCKARTFGTEDSSSLLAQDNCFVKMTLCNATVSNNYHVGVNETAGSITATTSSFITITSTSADDDCFLTVTGNSGGPSFIKNRGLLVSAPSALSSYKSIQTGNNWGSNVQNPWFVTVAQDVNSSDSPPGDFVGTGALDLLFKSDFQYSTTILLNPGVFTVTGTAAGSSQYKLIGNKLGNKYPVVSLNTSTTANTLGYSELALSAEVSHVKFKTADSSYRSVKLQFDTSSSTEGKRTIKVEDCVFKDINLFVDEISSLGTDADDTLATNTRILIKNSHFIQTLTSTDNVKFFLPSAESVFIENCTFEGPGYAGLIGEDSSLSYTHSSSLPRPLFVLRDNVFSLDSNTITSSSPATLDNYLTINDTEAKVVLDNNKIIVSNTYAARTTVIDAALATSFTAFIYANVNEIIVQNSTLNGPDQSFTSGGNSCQLPTLKITAQESAIVDNCNFFYGGLPLQFVGGFSGSRREGIIVSNCTFYALGSAVSQTLLDVDMDLSAASNSFPYVDIHDNVFETNSTTPFRVLHEEATYAAYNCQGVVQIYANYFTVNVHNNRIKGYLQDYATSPYSNYAALVINNFDSTTNTGVNILPVKVSNNNIYGYNFYTTATATDVAAVLLVKTTVLQVLGNVLNINNRVATASNHITCAYLDVRNSTSSSDGAEALVHHNLFSRVDDTGNLTSITWYFAIDSSSQAAGMATDNTFGSPTIDGSDTTTYQDNSSLWTVTRNKNQTESVFFNSAVGQLVVGLGSTDLSAAGTVATLDSDIRVNPSSSSATVRLDYNDTTANIQSRWMLPLLAILPSGVTITRATVTVFVSDAPTGASALASSTLRIVSAAGTDQDVQSALTTSGHVHDLAPPTFNHKISPSSTPAYLEVFASITSDGVLEYTAGRINIQYRW